MQKVLYSDNESTHKTVNRIVSSRLSSFQAFSSLDFIWRLASNFHNKVYYHNQPTDLGSYFNHPCGYMLLKANEEMGEAGLALRSASQIEATSILALASSVGAMIE
jgi:hypothetical protein